MSYEDHLAAFVRREEERKAEIAVDMEARRIAFKVAAEEGERLIRDIIRPELERLAAAVVAIGKQASVNVTKKKFSGEDAEYEVSVSLADMVHFLKYTADPNKKTFTVHRFTGGEEPRKDSAGFDQITQEKVAADCRAYVTKAFPLS